MGVARPITGHKSDFIVQGTIVENNAAVKVLIDSGSAASFVDKNCLKNLFDMIYPTNATCFRSLTDRFTIDSKIDLSLRVMGTEFRHSFYYDEAYLFSLPYDMILGRDVLNNIGVQLKWPNDCCLSLEEEEMVDLHKEDIYLPVPDKSDIPLHFDDCAPEMKPLLSRYSSIFSDESGIVDKSFEFDVQLTTQKPIRIPARRIPIHYEEEIKKQMHDLQERGIITRTNSTYSFPIVIAKKKNGDIRMCVDFRQLNKYTEKLACNIPQFEEIRNKLHGMKMFSTLDLSQGYWHIPLTENARDKLCFSPGPSWGNWSFNVMPFGPKNAPGQFQKCMEDMLGDLDFVFIYIDDILIFSRDSEEHCRHVEIVFDRIQKNNLHVKFSKCKFAKSEVEYLGYKLKDDTYSYGGNVRHVLMDYPLPASFKELESFIGLINYYRKFVKNFASTTKPLFDFKTSNDKSCKELKWTPELIDVFNQICSLIRKATPLAIPNPSLPFKVETDASDAAVGATLIQNGKPIHYSSRLLKKAELRYSTYEKELVAILFALKQYYDCLIGKKFILRCDHRPLIWIKEQKIKGRIGRWILTLQEFEFDIEHIAGAKNSVADTLSRPVNAVIPEVRKFDWTELQKPLLENYKAGNSKELTKYSKYIHVNGDILKFKNRIVVPLSQVSHLLKQIHEILGHPGGHRMLDFIRIRYFWPNMFSDIKSFVRNCQLCSLSKSYSYFQNKEYQFHGDYPFQKISIDVKGPVHVTKGGYRYILVIKDSYSGYCSFYPLTSKQSENILDRFVEFICIFGKPMCVLSDGGLEFSALRKFCEEHHISHASCSAFHHGNGSVERAIRWLEEKLIQDSTNWSDKLNYWQFNYNFLHSSTTGLCPNDIVFSFKTRHVNDFDYPDIRSLDLRPTTHRCLNVGDTVLVKDSLRRKGSPYYLPDKFTVMKIQGQSIIVKSGSKVLQRHITFLKPC